MSANVGNVLVGGGTGFVGSRLCSLLKNKGYGVTVVSRMPGLQRISWNDIQGKGLPDKTIAVVNLAGQNVMDVSRRWTSGFKQNVYNSRVNTTKLLANKINEAKQKPAVFVTISGVGIYKPDPTREYTEDSQCETFDFFSKLCKNWENAAVLNIHTQKLCRTVTIRSGVVLGKNGGMIKQLYLPFFLGLGGPVGSGTQFMPWIHIDDLSNLIIFSIENSNVTGILNGVAPNPCTNKEFSEAFAKALRRPAVIPLPSLFLNVVLNKERAIMITDGQKVLPNKTLSMGFKYQYPDITSSCNALVK